MNQEGFAINQHEFQPSFFNNLSVDRQHLELWPLVYILSDEGKLEAYIGETTDVRARMKAHLKHVQKQQLTTVHLLSSPKFNKSATLDIESKLIRYMAGDGKYSLLNGNLGLVDHSYYNQDYYDELFKNIWNQLWQKGLVVHSLDHITNSDLFKYSPYKSLGNEQREGLFNVMEALLSPSIKNTVVEGGAGTGKTILAIFLFKLLASKKLDFDFREFGDDQKEFYELVQKIRKKFPDPKMALVVPMSSFRGTLKKVFRQTNGLKSSMVVGPMGITKSEYDIILVDEGHRLRRRVNLGGIYEHFDEACKRLGLDEMKATEVDWVVKQSKKAIIFYDSSQSIKPSDAEEHVFSELKNNPSTEVQKLKSQFRVQGGNAYVGFIDKLLGLELEEAEQYHHPNYEVKAFCHFPDFIDEIKAKNEQYGLSRLIAGYSWPWISKKNPKAFDIEIEGVSLKWNSTNLDWINSEKAIEEVGCIHTTQGYDLNYAGVIFGHEISYDPKKDEIIIDKNQYFDRNGKSSIKDPNQLKAYILNIYKTILLRGIKGTLIYACDPNLRDYLAQHIGNKVVQKDTKLTLSFLDSSEVKPYENALPFYDIKVAAGDFPMPQSVEEVDWIAIPNDINASKDYFVTKVYGNSMNKVIPDNSWVLFKRYQGGSRIGKIVLVQSSEIQDQETGSSFTVKEYWSKKIVSADSWEHSEIRLKPLSNDDSFQDIILSDSDGTSLKVVGEFVKVIK